MTDSFNFNFHNNEFGLFNSIQDEIVEKHGIQVWFLPRTLQKFDMVFGEDPISKFEKAFQMTMFLDSYSAFNGQGDLFAKFGLNVTDQVSLIIQRDRFYKITDNHEPIEEDLIFFSLNGGVFEIYHVEKEDPFYIFGKKSMFKFECRLFEYANEKIKVGIKEVDQLDTMTDTQVESENDEFDSEVNRILETSHKNPFGNL